MQTSEENTQGIVHQNEEGRCPEIDHHICSLSKLLNITDFHPALRCKPFSDDADDQLFDGNAYAAQLPQIFARNMHFSAGPSSKIFVLD